ncbi:MAG: putative metalloprotease CJM1_0395 family protein [Phycisphaerae bacterium]
MIGTIGDPLTASSLANIYLRELGSARRSQAPSRTDAIGSAQEAQGVGGKSELTEEEKREVAELEKRDREVRQHEAAHKTAAGQYARGAPQLEYTRGPDGKQYATGGEVDIDTSEVPGDPQATIRKMQQVRRAASAPAHPSAQDRTVAAQAAQIEARARVESTTKRRDENGGEANGASGGASRIGAGGSGAPGLIASLFSQPRAIGAFVDVHV